MKTDTRRLAAELEGRALGPAAAVDTAALGTDSRRIGAGELFIALRGPRFDGNRFAKAALAAGAAAAVVERPEALEEGQPGILVPDALEALWRMARRARERSATPVWVGLTGSNGKTTARGMVAAILRLRGPVHETAGNQNNAVGLPLTLCRTPEDAWAAVVEMGVSEPGEMAFLAGLVRPQIGLVTSVGLSHAEGLGGAAGVAREKGALFEALPADGLAVYPAFSPWAGALRDRAPCATASFAVEGPDLPAAGADLVAQEVELSPEGSRFKAAGAEVRLRLLGRHNVANALSALLVGRRLGIGYGEAAGALAGIGPVAGRLRLRQGACLAVLDDAYNASPASLEAAIEALAVLPGGRKLAMIGDMLELGPVSRDLHRQAGRLLGSCGLDALLAVGHETLALAEAADGRHARTRVAHFASLRALLAGMEEYLQPGDTVLVKGSRGMRMDLVADALAAWSPDLAERARR